MRAPAWVLISSLIPAVWGQQKVPPILTEDVTRFFRIYDAASGHPTVEQLDRDYLGPGSEGLHRFAKERNVSGATISDAIGKRPQIYNNARRCLTVLPAVKRRLIVAFETLGQLYPEANFSAPVTIVIGRGKPVGMTNASGVFIGLEALCAADFMNPDVEERFVHVIAHEYGHIQQSNTDPTGATVLFASLMEGAADFIAELISGDVGNGQFKSSTKGHEASIEAAFVEDEDKTDLSKWLYNGQGTPEHPGDLGYWVGYRIVKSYYEHASDKHQALREIFEMKDPKAFLAHSGWRPAEK